MFGLRLLPGDALALSFGVLRLKTPHDVILEDGVVASGAAFRQGVTSSIASAHAAGSTRSAAISVSATSVTHASTTARSPTAGASFIACATEPSPSISATVGRTGSAAASPRSATDAQAPKAHAQPVSMLGVMPLLGG